MRGQPYVLIITNTSTALLRLSGVVMDGIPFELLDPCCQKDVLEKRRAKEVKERLGTTDPSVRKEKQLQSVFTNLSKTSTCHACCTHTDYPMLMQVRAEVQAEQEALQHAGHSSDSDSDYDFGDEFESAMEKEMKAKMVQRNQLLELKRRVGLGVHVEESEAHALDLIDAGSRVVLHLYDPRSSCCARIDISLEDAAKRYSATKFRRISMSIAAEKICPMFMLPMDTALVACFMDQHLVTYTSNEAELVPGGEISSKNLFRFLDNSKVVTDDDAEGLLMPMTLDYNENSSDEDMDEDSNEYCGVPGCRKKYRHTHIATSSEGGSNAFSGADAGSEVFDENYFSKL